MQKSLHSLCLFFIALTLAGCAAMQTSPGDPGTPIALARIGNLTYAPSDLFPSETTTVVRDQATWQNLWAQINRNLSPTPALPEVDFTKNLVVVAAMGTRPRGGYRIEMPSASQNSTGVVIEVMATSPGATCAVPTVITSPVDVAIIPLTSAPIAFNITRKTQNCS